MRASRVILLLITLATISSCTRKGSEDPALSLRSRKARLVNSWTLSQWDQLQITKTSGGESTESVSFYGNTQTVEFGSVIESHTYQETFEIYKNGTFQRSYTVDGVTNTYTGNWHWLDSGKNKSMVAFDNDQGTWAIIELKNKEMILQQYYTVSDSEGYSYTFFCNKLYSAP